MNNRMWNSSNPHQGKYLKCLTVCSAGLLRSPTAALVLSQEPFNFNTRCVGIEKDFALIPIDDVVLAWADIIVCMTQDHEDELMTMTNKPIYNLNIQDSFAYRDDKLMWLIKEKFTELYKGQDDTSA